MSWYKKENFDDAIKSSLNPQLETVKAKCMECGTSNLVESFGSFDEMECDCGSRNIYLQPNEVR